MKVTNLVLAAVIAVLTGACSAPPPPTPVEAARAKAKAAQERRQAQDVINSMMAQPIDCAEAAKDAFDVETGNPIVWVIRNPKKGKLECFDQPGKHRNLRMDLLEITTKEVEEIESRQDLYPPRPKVIVEPQTIVVRPAPIVIAPRPVIVLDEPCSNPGCR